jgi:hypothetical protein
MSMAFPEPSKFNLAVAFLALYLLYKFFKSQHERRVCPLKSLTLSSLRIPLF